MIENINGKQTPRKIGLAAVQRDGMEYEFDIVGTLDDSSTLTITKTRYSDIAGATVPLPDSSFGEQLKAWLSDGAELEHPQILEVFEDYDHEGVLENELFPVEKMDRIYEIAVKLFNIKGHALDDRMLEAASKILKLNVTNLSALHKNDGNKIMRQLEGTAVKRGVWEAQA